MNISTLFVRPLFLAGLFLLAAGWASSLSGQWNGVPSFPAGPTDGSFSFVIDDVAYVGGGLHREKVYSFSSATRQWTYLHVLPGKVPLVWAFAFSYQGKGYVCGGAINGGTLTDEFFEYNPENNSWTKKAPFGGGARDGGFAFVLGDHAYVGTGFDGSFLHNDVWKYSFADDMWTKIDDFPGGPLIFPSSFVLNGKGYVIGGQGSVESDRMFEFDPSTESWTEKARFGGGARQAGSAFALGGKGYYGTGMSGYTRTFTDFWEYDPVTDAWSELEHEYPSAASAWNIAFVLDGKAYVGTGAEFAGQGVVVSDEFYSYPYEEPLPSAGVSAESIAFGNVITGETHYGLIQLKSLSEADLEVKSVEFANPNAADLGFAFTPDGPVPSTLPGLGSLAISLSFTPVASGLVETDLVITTNDPAMPVITISVSGIGVQESELPGAVLSTSVLDFGDVKVGESAARTFTVVPSNSTELEIQRIFTFNDFNDAVAFVTSRTLPTTLSEGEELEVTVTYAPTRIEDLEAGMSVQTNSAVGSALQILGHGVEGISSTDLPDEMKGVRVNLYPNPVREYLQMEVTVPSTSDVDIRLIDASGKTVLPVHNGSVPAGVHNYVLNIRNLPAGSYFVESLIGEEHRIRRVVIGR